MGEQVLEAFYLIAPRLSFKDGKIAGREAEVSYCYPSDTRHRFIDIPLFCFPDLEQIKLESMALSRQEHFAFTLTDDHGKRFYGVCMRYLDQGEGMRFDVGLRPRICLCIITQHNQPSLFRLLLLLMHSLLLFHNNDVAALEPLLQTICSEPLPRLGGVLRLHAGIQQPIQLSIPLHAQHSHVMSLPLLQRLGSAGLLTLLSVCLTERRIIFTADEMTTLSSSVHACVSLLYPFEWHHIYIPVLPAKLLGYVSAPMPFIIGVKRYMMQQVMAQPTSDIVIVDVDKGEITTTGDVALTTFLGKSGTMLRQATEGFERVKHRAKKILHTLQQNDAEETQLAQNSSRDAVAYVLTELKAINLKHTQIKWPGKSLMTGKQGDEWQTAAEGRLRDTLLLFFTYHFHDVDRIVKRAGTGGNQRSNIDAFRTAFLESRRAAGDGQAVLSFLREFVHSQMFEQFCGSASESQHQSSGDESEHADTFDLCRRKLRASQLAPSIPNIVKIIRSVLHDESSSGIPASRNSRSSTYYDKIALALTSNSEAQFDTKRAMEQVIARSFSSEHFTKIVRTLRYRFQDCKGGNWRHANKALTLLAVLLVSGPEYVLSEALQLFHHVRGLKMYRSTIPASYMRLIRTRATRCIQLLLDHKALLLQRAWARARQKGMLPSRNLQVSRLVLLPGGEIPRLSDLHSQLRPASIQAEPSAFQHYDMQPRPLTRGASSESDDSVVSFHKHLTFDEDPFVRVSAIDLLLNGTNDGDDQDDRVPLREAHDRNLLDLDDFLQRSPTNHTQSPIHSQWLSYRSEPSTPTSHHHIGNGSDWNGSCDDPFLSRSGSIASAADQEDDVFALFSSTSSFTQPMKQQVEQELLRPPTPDTFDQFDGGFVARQETHPFAAHPFSSDPFAKPATNNVELLLADPFGSANLQPQATARSTAGAPSGDLIDLMTPQEDPRTSNILDMFSSNSQVLSASPIRPSGNCTPYHPSLASDRPPNVMASPFAMQQLQPGLSQHSPHLMSSPPQYAPQYGPQYTAQHALVPAGQMMPMAGPHSTGPGAQGSRSPFVTPVRPRTQDPFADLGLPNFK